MRIIGCDLHARQQTLAMLDTETGEVVNQTLAHEGESVREFYSTLPGPVRVGIEVLPKNWSRRRERKSGKMGGLKGGLSDEKDSIQRGTDRLRIAASGDGDTGGRGNPEDG